VSILPAVGFWTVAVLTVPAPPPSLEVRALAILQQASDSLSENVAGGELGQVHNEDELLYGALAVLGRTGTPAQLDRLIPALGRRVSDLHEAADAFDRALAQSRLPVTLEAFRDVMDVFGEAEIAAAKALAARFTCPMHPDVDGVRGEACPKCAMPLDTRRRVGLEGEALTARPTTVRAEIRTEAPLAVGVEAKGTLSLAGLLGPLQPKDLREVHTKKIHLLIVDPSLDDYHHEHPVPTEVAGEYAFRFTPRKAGAYRAYADVQPLLTGFQEYAPAAIGDGAASGVVEKAYPRSGQAGDLRYELAFDAETLHAGTPVAAHVRVTKAGAPFEGLEPVMAAFAHLVGFHEGGTVVLHMHPIESRALGESDRGGPDLSFRFFAETPGYYRLFLQTQVGGEAQFVPFGIEVQP
jgi:hypothetical protein